MASWPFFVYPDSHALPINQAERRLHPFDVASVDFENITRYVYDELGRLKTVSAVERNDVLIDVAPMLGGDQADETSYFYDSVGNLDRTLYGNGVGHHYEYDSLNRLDKLTHFVDSNGNQRFDDGEQRAEFDYEIDQRADGKRTGVVETFWSQDIPNDPLDDPSLVVEHQNTFTWSYDEVGRLIGEVLDSSDNTLDYTDAFFWDLAGNRSSTSRNWDDDNANEDYTTSYWYDQNDRLTSETKDFVDPLVDDETITYVYDFTQQTSKTTAVAGTTTTVQSFDYDLQGRMSLVTIDKYAANGVTIESTETTNYEYDSQGNRVATVHTANGKKLVETLSAKTQVGDLFGSWRCVNKPFWASKRLIWQSSC